MHSQDWKLELTDRDGTVHCRLLQGTAADQPDPWREIVPWQSFATATVVAELLTSSQQLLATHDAWVAAKTDPDLRAAAAAHASARGDLATRLQTALPQDVWRKFAHWEWAASEFGEDSGAAPLLQVAVLGSVDRASHAQDLLAACRFEVLPAFASGSVGIRRLQVPGAKPPRQPVEPPAAYRPLRVLILVGDLHDPLSLDRHAMAALATLREVQKRLASQPLGQAIDVVIAAAAGCAKQLSAVDVDLVLRDEGQLEQLLRCGTLARGEPVPYQALLTLGHSDANVGSTATGMQFDFGPGERRTLTAAKLADWFMQDLQFVLLLNCKSHAFASQFLPRVDHVLAAAPMLRTDHARTLMTELFEQQLLRDTTLADAVRRTRAKLEQSTEGSGWSLVHLARTEADCAFLSRERWTLIEFHRSAYTHEATPRLGYGSKQLFELTRIHVPLQVGQRSKGSDGAAPAAGTVSPPELRLATDVRFDELLRQGHKRWLIRGEPGGGKSTTLRVCALRPPAGKVVVYWPLARWVRSTSDATVTGASLCRDLAEAGLREPIGALIDQRAKLGDLIVLLDAYDEVPEEHRDRVDRLLRWFDHQWPRVTVVVTARLGTKLPIGGDKGGDEASASRSGTQPSLRWQTAEVRPMGPDEQLQLLTNWFLHARVEAAATCAAAAHQELQRSGPRMQEMVSNPLLLTFLADRMLRQLARGGADQAPDFTWLERLRRHELLADVVTTWLEGGYTTAGNERKQALSVPPQEAPKLRETMRQWLARIAWHMTVAGVYEATTPMLASWLFPDALDGDGVDVAAWLDRRNWTREQCFSVLRDHSGVLRPDHALAEAPWRFSHRHVQEALAAEYWWKVGLGAVPAGERPLALLAQMRERITEHGAVSANKVDAWIEAFAMVVERLPHGDQLLVPLLREKATRPLGIRVLMALDEVQPETVRELLVADPRSAIGSAALPAWGDEFEDLPPFGGWRPRALVLELLGERLERDAKQAHAAMAPLLERAKQPDVLFAEIGAIVWCLERAGQRWWPRDAFARWQRLPLSSRVRCWPKVVREAVEGILAQPCFGRLTDADVAEHFARTPVPRGADEPRRRQGQRTLWPLIPAVDDFEMGSHDYEDETPPASNVKLAAYRCQATHVTNGQWRRFRSKHPADQPWQPVVNVRWYEGLLFARWLTRQRQQLAGAAWGVEVDAVFDLPTEAESERAIRGGTNTKYWSGNDEADLARVAWYSGNSDSLHDVAEREANAFGIHDAHGNAWIWALDAYQPRLMGGDSPIVLRSGAPRVQRGGCVRSGAGLCRAAFRFDFDPGDGDGYVGVRLVCVRVSPQLDP